MGPRLPGGLRGGLRGAVVLLVAMLWSVLSFGQADPGAGVVGGAGGGAVPAARQATNVAVITIKEPGGITQTTYQSVHRRLGLAERAGANAVVFEIDTPGGELGAVRGICNDIKASPIKNTVAWIRHDAYSGGAIIALACREIVVADPATLGDAIPIAIDQSTGKIRPIPETERQKLMAPLIAELVDSARRNGHDEMLVQGIAARGVELWRIRNNRTGQLMSVTRAEYRTVFGEEPPDGLRPRLASVALQPDAPEAEPLPERAPGQGRNSEATSQPLPSDEPDRFIPASPTLEQVARNSATPEQSFASSRPVLTSADRGAWTLVEYISDGNGPLVLKREDMLHYSLAAAGIQTDEELMAFFGARHLLRLEPSWSEGLVTFLTWVPIRGVLIVVFLLALFIEMTHPGLVLPGTIAAAALIGLLAPPMLINMANWWEVAAIVAGVGLVALEIFVLPGFGIFGMLGLLLLFGGIVGTFIPAGGVFPDTPGQRNDMLYGGVTVILAIATSGVLMWFISRHFASIPIFHRLILKDPAVVDEGGIVGDELLAAMADPSGPVRKGMAGVALTPLRPAGRIELGGPGGRIVDVVSDLGYIPAGARVRIVSVSDFRISVEPVDPGEPQAGPLGVPPPALQDPPAAGDKTE